MSPIEFRREVVQYASAALTGILANRSITNSLTATKEHVGAAAWEYAEAMYKAAPSEKSIQEWRRKLE